jgi:hypothetical protein
MNLCALGLEEMLKKTSGKYCVGDEVIRKVDLFLCRR